MSITINRTQWHSKDLMKKQDYSLIFSRTSRVLAILHQIHPNFYPIIKGQKLAYTSFRPVPVRQFQANLKHVMLQVKIKAFRQLRLTDTFEGVI